ncbi:hemolysin family protein [Dactylosporangium sp. NPDC000555]|uniref:hemolysin family protein n=1 Tax=Dactylosporangium sp. NPDC000555 TaxID=3154260 RepID=UPI0033281F95
MSPTTALVASLALLALNAFFVAAEFALVASKRHRLEALAAGGSPAARAALAGNRELSLMLAGSQLGITLCSLGLGALAKPAVADLLEPLLRATGLPSQASYVAAFILALAVVVFLHMVVGEMAPKSWAITQPERSAVLLAVPFRAFARLARPALAALNAMANATLRLFKITPQEELAQAHGPEELLILLQTSRRHGTLPASDEQLLTAMLTLQHTTVATVMVPIEQVVTVHAGATARDVEQLCLRHGRSRLPVTDNGHIVGVVHARDALKATTGHVDATAGYLMTTPYTLPAQCSALSAIRSMREHRAQVAIVTEHDGPIGLVALEDLLEQVIGQFDDETDPIVAAYRNAPARQPH